MVVTHESTPPTPASLRVLRCAMSREDALCWLVDLCGLTIHEASELLDGTSYAPPRDSNGGRNMQPGFVQPMKRRTLR